MGLRFLTEEDIYFMGPQVQGNHHVRSYSTRSQPLRANTLRHKVAWAIAGAFGLDIYCISLVDPNLTEEELGMLFTSLPRRVSEFCLSIAADLR